MIPVQRDIIKQQMDNEERKEDDYSSSDSGSDSSSDSSSDISSDSGSDRCSEKSFHNEIIGEPESNNANIDEILSGKNIITDNSLSDILNVDSDLSNIDEYVNSIKKANETKIITKDYNDMTVSELKQILVDMKLPVSGNKTKLIERIKENKK